MSTSSSSSDIDWDLVRTRLESKYTIEEDTQHWIPKKNTTNPCIQICGTSHPLKHWMLCLHQKQIILSGRPSTICDNIKCVNPDHLLVTSKMEKGISEWSNDDWNKIKMILESKYIIEKDGNHWIPSRNNTTKSVVIRGIIHPLKHWMVCLQHKESNLSGTLSTICSNIRCVNPEHLLMTGKMEKGALQWSHNDYLSLQKRLEKRSEVSTDPAFPECIVWTGPIRKDGYVSSSIKKRPTLAHTAAFLLKTKTTVIPDGLEVRHMCDNRACIKPEHLILGTHGDNMEDKIKHGRASIIPVNVAREVKNSKGVGTPKERALRYKVGVSTVYKIDTGKTHKWLAEKEEDDFKNKAPEKQKVATIYDTSWYDEASEYIQQRIDIKEYHWIWTGGCQYEYGTCHFKGTPYLAHRLAYFAFNHTTLPATIMVRHNCTEKLCVNPDHLAQGTAKDNALDRIRDGTSRKGELHHNVKLTKESVCEIIANRAKGIRQRDLALQFNVSIGAIAHIDCNNTWKNIPRPIREIRKEHHRATVKEGKVRQIIASKGMGTKRQRAERFGVTMSFVNHIDNKQSWKHLPRPGDLDYVDPDSEESSLSVAAESKKRKRDED